jgi:hypothetical protein
MRTYIKLNGKKYATVHRKWAVEVQRAQEINKNWDGTLTAQVGQVLDGWRGSVKAPITRTASDIGTIDDLRALFELTQAVPFEDHYGNPAINVILQGPFAESSIINDLDSASNAFVVTIRLVKA